MKRRVFEIIEKAEDGDKPSKIFDYFILGLITLTVIVVVVDNSPSH